jgi:hypothetical protein
MFLLSLVKVPLTCVLVVFSYIDRDDATWGALYMHSLLNFSLAKQHVLLSSKERSKSNEVNQVIGPCRTRVLVSFQVHALGRPGSPEAHSTAALFDGEAGSDRRSQPGALTKLVFRLCN